MRVVKNPMNSVAPQSRNAALALSQTLPYPVGQLGLAELRQVVDALFAEVDAAEVDVLGGGSADPLHDDGGIGFEDDAVVDDLVDGEGDQAGGGLVAVVEG